MNEIVYASAEWPAEAPKDSWLLALCREGSPLLVTDGAALRLQPGDAVILPPGLYTAPEDFAASDSLCLALNHPSLPTQALTVLRPQFFDLLYAAAQAAAFHFATPSYTRSGLLGAYGSVIVGYIYSAREEQKHSAIVREIASQIHAHCADSAFELDAFLRTLPFSYDYLRKLFQSEVGLTPHQYLMDLRLQNAVYLLSQLDADRSMAEIARLCGFREPLYFSRVFKKKYGVSPSFYIAHQLPTLPDA